MIIQEAFPGRGQSTGDQERNRLSESDQSAFPGGVARDETDMDEDQLDETLADADEDDELDQTVSGSKDEPVLDDEDLDDNDLTDDDAEDVEWEEPKS